MRAYSSRLTIQTVSQLRQNSQLQDKLPAAELCWTIDQITQACNRFYLPLLEQEISIIRQRNYAGPDWEQRIHRLLTSIKPLLEANKAMLLRVGRHSGAEAVTLNGVRNIKIMQCQGRTPKSEPQPCTLWLAAAAQGSRSEMTPFGWLLTEIDPPDKPPVTLEDLSKQVDDSKQQWLEKQRRRIATLQEKRT